MHKGKGLIILLFSTLALTGLRAESISSPLTSLASDTSRVTDLDEVVIIAQPKESGRLRTLPIASTMFSANDMHSLGLTDVRQISLYVPSFTMPEYGSRYTSSAYVRGIGSKEGSSAVGMYVDNIPLVTKSMYNFHTYGLERVDVLRGPQGTLYGMNSEGGLLRLYSRNPMNYQGTDIRAAGGTYGLRDAEVAHYHHFNDRFALAVASFYDGQQGFWKNQTTDRSADLSNEAGGRIRLVYRPADSLSLDFTADYQWVDQKGFPYGQLYLSTGRTALPTMDYDSDYLRHLLTTGLSLQWRTEKFTLSNTTSFQFLRDHMHMDIDYTAADLMRMNQHQRQKALTEELSLKGHLKQWQWTSGLFLSSLWQKVDAPIFFRPAMNTYLSQTIQNAAYTNISMFNTPEQIEARGGVSIRMDIDDPIYGLFSTPQQAFGLFHESSYDITKRLTATVGLRYDLSHVAIDYNTGAATHLVYSVLGKSADVMVSDHLTNSESDIFHQLLPKAALRYRVGKSSPSGELERGLVYATVSKGYRAGGYNIQTFGDILQPELRTYAQQAPSADTEVPHTATDYANIRDAISYKPETSWNYELGTHLNLFHHRLQLDAALYYMEVHNQQVAKFANNYGYGRLTVNAAESYSCGAEISLRGYAHDNRLSYNLSYGYTYAVFRRFTDKINGKDISYNDNFVPFVPAHTLAARADYRIPFKVRALQSLTIGANVTSQGKTYWDETNSYFQSFYATLGAHVRLLFAHDIGLDIWGRNLTQSRYNTFAFDSSASGTQLFFAQRGAPLHFGATLSLHF